MREADAVILIVKALVQNNKKFRVVTPYDAQRGLIEHKLRSEGLPWKDKCFNVDSFQGTSTFFSSPGYMSVRADIEHVD